MEPPSSSSSSSSSSPSSSLQQSSINFLDQPFLVNIGIVLFLLWLASFFHVSSIWIFALAFLFLFEANRIYVKRLRRQMRSEGKRSALQDRPLSDFQEAQWLNQAIEKMWPQFLEKAISQDILGPMIPWFLDRFKPGTVAKVVLQQLSLGRRPPMFTGVRIVDSASGDDHLIMELHLHFLAGEDMTAVLSAQMRGLGIWTNIHISKLLIEGKVRVGIKLLNELPYLSRVRLNFETLPEVQMTVRPLFTHGVNVSDIPLVAGWMDRLVADIFEKCLVQPNMVVVDVEELVNKITSATPKSAAQETWCKIEQMEPVAVAHLKIIEASKLKPSDFNGLADPFVKGSCANEKFTTKIQKNTLNPKWFQDFDIQIFSWENLPPLSLRLYDKDTIYDDKLGFCSINLAKYRNGQCNDFWIALEDVTTGELHISVTVVEREKVQDSRLKEVLPPDYALEEEYPIEKFEVIRLGNKDNGYISIVSPGEHSATKDRRQRQSPEPKIEKVSTYFEEESKDAKEKNMSDVQFVRLSARKSVDGDPSIGVEETEVVAENDIGTDSEQQDDERSENPSKRHRVKNKAKGMMKSMNNHLNAALSRKGSSNNMAASGTVQPSV